MKNKTIKEDNELTPQEKINLSLKIIVLLVTIGLWIYRLYVPAFILTLFCFWDFIILLIQDRSWLRR